MPPPMYTQVRTSTNFSMEPLARKLTVSPEAMMDALQKDSRIHRDLSVGNIILVQDGDASARRGYLIDWEASCKIDDGGDAIERGRVVSWYITLYRISTKKSTGHMAVHVHAIARRL